MCGQRKVGRRQRARRRFACRLYPSHGPSWFITSRWCFEFASTVRKTKRLRRRLNWYCLEKTPGIPGSINKILYEEAPGLPEVQPLNLDRNGTNFVYPLLTNGTPFHIHLGRQNHNDKPVRFSGIFIFFMSRPGSVKSWIPSFKTNGKVIEKINKENKNRKIKWWIIFARYFSFQHKPSSTGAKKEKWIQTQDERYICEILIHRKRKWFI